MEEMVTYFGNLYLYLCFLLHVPILLLQYLPPVQLDSCQMSPLHASEIPCRFPGMLQKRWCSKGVRDCQDGWSTGGSPGGELVNWRLLTPLLPLECRSHFQGRSLEKARCGDCLDIIQD